MINSSVEVALSLKKLYVVNGALSQSLKLAKGEGVSHAAPPKFTTPLPHKKVTILGLAGCFNLLDLTEYPCSLYQLLNSGLDGQRHSC